MTFSSIEFGCFITLVFGLYWFINEKYRGLLLLAASYIFYAFNSIKYCVLLLVVSVVSYFMGNILYKNKNKSVLALSLIVILSPLFVYKYFDFFFRTSLNLLLPVGISFFTFEAISYLVDIYNGKMESEESVIAYFTYLSFFPTVTSGPIERAKHLLNEVKKEHHFDYVQATYGIKQFTWGLFKKIVIADFLAKYVDMVYSDVFNYTGFILVLTILFYSVQIYCDFSGYSDMAIGIAKCLNIELGDNFRSPYFSASIKELWQRWHISLSSWLRDYIYIPLGGNRKGKIRTYINLIITFLVSGLWHGASLTFVFWGLCHGLLQVFENILGLNSVKRQGSFIWWIRVIFVFCLTSLIWVAFRVPKLGIAKYVYLNLFYDINRPYYFQYALWTLGIFGLKDILNIVLRIIPLVLFDYFSLKVDVIECVTKQKTVIRYIIYSVLVLSILLFHAIGNVSFVYFQF